MAGGSIEYVMVYYSGASTTWGATSSNNYAGFSSAPDSKYYDNYTTTSALTACNGGVCYGHGLLETSGWYGDSLGFVKADMPWLCRGANSITMDSRVGVFNGYGSIGGGAGSYSFRSVMVNVG